MKTPPKPPTAAEMNAAALAAWEKWNAQIRDFEEKHPDRAAEIARHSADLVAEGLINNKRFVRETGYVGAIINDADFLATEESRKQSARASKPRKRKVTLRSEMMAAMRLAKATGSGRKDFLESIEGDDIGPISVVRLNRSDANLYLVSCDSLDKDEEVLEGTLHDWWTDA